MIIDSRFITGSSVVDGPYPNTGPIFDSGFVAGKWWSAPPQLGKEQFDSRFDTRKWPMLKEPVEGFGLTGDLEGTCL